jgi:hypothetical protein
MDKIMSSGAVPENQDSNNFVFTDHALRRRLSVITKALGLILVLGSAIALAWSAMGASTQVVETSAAALARRLAPAESTADLRALGESQKCNAIRFRYIAKNMSCKYHYKTDSSATTPQTCAIACTQRPGCVVFSHGSGHGCRLSACRSPDAESKGRSCGFAEEGAAAVAKQCGTTEVKGEDLYYLVGYDVIATDTVCEYQYTSVDKVKSASCCRQACDAAPKCNVFSFGKATGCRISTCGSKGDKSNCGKSPADNAIAIKGQCGTKKQLGTYLYAFEKRVAED